MTAAFNLKNIVEAALLAAGRPLSLDALQALFDGIECPEKKALRGVLQELAEDYRDRGIEIAEVATGWRIQVGQACSPWVSRLWDERPARYSRALMETLALIAYRQPITRGEIEDIRGVSVSTNIVKTLLEREWVRVVGQRDVPGKPSLYGTTREFLDYFGLKSLEDLPTLAELRDLDEINRELDLSDPDRSYSDGQAGGDASTGETSASADGDVPAAEADESSDTGQTPSSETSPIDSVASETEAGAADGEIAPAIDAAEAGDDVSADAPADADSGLDEVNVPGADSEVANPTMNRHEA
jgi:segregation and condensation protein B